MRKGLIALFLTSALYTFGQGKITVGTDVLTSLVTFTSFASRLFPVDVALAGQPVPTDLNLLPSRTRLVFGCTRGKILAF